MIKETLSKRNSNTILDTGTVSSSSQDQELARVDTGVEILQQPGRTVKLPERFEFQDKAAIPFPITTSNQPSDPEGM